MEKLLLKIIPRKFRRKLRKLYYFPQDILSRIFRNNDDLIPPMGKIFIGGGDFTEVGEIFMGYFKDLGQIRPSDRILDVGCGIGRMAIPLTKYLNTQGSYEGFDIVEEGIEWCNKNINDKFPNFKFKHVDIYNKDYNPKGKISGIEFKFPYEDNSFDFAFLTSVFTHMVPEDVENYLSEIHRVLKAGSGKSLITYFLLNEESKRLISESKSQYDFKYNFGIYSSTHQTIPEAVLAYEQDYILDLYSKLGLEILEPIRYGSFCGRDNYLSHQDIIIARKK